MPSRKIPSETQRLADTSRELGLYFRRNGYVRRQNPKRLRRDGYLGYKKGDEVRLTAQDEHELSCLQALLMRAGFRTGRPFVKGRQYCLPIYGRQAVRRFLRLVESGGNAEPGAPPMAAPRRRSASRKPRRGRHR